MNAAESAERWHVVGFREAVYRTADGHTRAGGCCERCSQGIRYVVKVKSSVGGRTMDVGQDCAVTMQGGPELADIRRAEAAYRRELAREESERTRPEREARERAERVAREEIEGARAARNVVEFASLLADLDVIIASEVCGEFERGIASDIATKLRAGKREDGLSEHVTERGFCELWCIGGAVATARAGAHKLLSADVGARVTVGATLIRATRLDGEYGPTYIATFRTDDGATLLWKSSTHLMCEQSAGRPQFDFCRPGERVEMVATVKAHSDYRGEPQTVVTRAKMYRPGTMPVKPAKKSRKSAQKEVD